MSPMLRRAAAPSSRRKKMKKCYGDFFNYWSLSNFSLRQTKMRPRDHARKKINTLQFAINYRITIHDEFIVSVCVSHVHKHLMRLYFLDSKDAFPFTTIFQITRAQAHLTLTLSAVLWFIYKPKESALLWLRRQDDEQGAMISIQRRFSQLNRDALTKCEADLKKSLLSARWHPKLPVQRRNRFLYKSWARTNYENCKVVTN
jgi:hypothetical protein